MRLATKLLILISLLFVVPAQAEIIYQDDAENAYDSHWEHEEGPVTSSTDYAKKGSRSYKFLQSAGYQRSELTLSDSTMMLTRGDDLWFAWSMYFPAGWELPPAGPDGRWCAVGQWHFWPDDCDGPYCQDEGCGWALNGGQPFAFYINESGANLKIDETITYQTTSCYTSETWFNGVIDQESSAFTRGAWHNVVVNVKFSITGTGYNKVWLDGVQWMNETNINNDYNNTHPPYFKIGIYAGDMGEDTLVYIDEIRIGKNSTYEEMSSGTEDPDTTPPVVSNFSPSSTLTAGTTSTPISWSTDEPATCKWDTSDTTYALMSNTAAGTGTQSHSDTLTGLTDGSTTIVYKRCQDDEETPNVATTSTQSAVTVEAAGGSGGSNLLNSTVCSIDYAPYSGMGQLALAFDGSTDPDTSSVFSWDHTAAVVSCTFPTSYTHPYFKIFGDSGGSLVSTDWEVKYKAAPGDGWSTAFTGSSCNGGQWYIQDQSAIATAIRYLQITINGDEDGYQFNELWMNADPYEDVSPVLPAASKGHTIQIGSGGQTVTIGIPGGVPWAVIKNE